MKSKLFTKTLATIALGAFCIGGTTVFAETLTTKLSLEDVLSNPPAEQGSMLAVSANNGEWTNIASSEPIQFGLQAGWDLQRPQATLELAKSEAAAAALAAAAAQAAQAAQAAAVQAVQPIPAPAATPAPTSSKQAAILSKAKAKTEATKANAKVAAAVSQPVQPEVQAAATGGQSIQDHQGKSYTYKKVINATASAYSGAPEENGGYAGLDYYGNALKVGTIAVDPKVIPLGTSVLVKGYTFDGLPQTLLAKATDIGGAIKGNKIDIFIPGAKSYVNSFGLQSVQIYVLN